MEEMGKLFNWRILRRRINLINSNEKDKISKISWISMKNCFNKDKGILILDNKRREELNQAGIKHITKALIQNFQTLKT